MSVRMHPVRRTIPIDEALAIVREVTVPIERTEHVPLARLVNRVLAADVAAAEDVPAFDRALMDGYAVRADDTRGASPDRPVELRCIGVTYTGQEAGPALGTGECVEISTGAPLPPHASAVVMVEDAARPDDGPVVTVRVEVREGQNIGRRGSDVRAGEVVARAGEPVTVAGLGAIAVVGSTGATVYARPRVGILSSGDEVRPPGTPLRTGQVYDVNRFTLAALVERHGGEPVLFDTLADTPQAFAAALDRARDLDLVVCSGGSSAGERDVVVETLKARGTLLFHGLAVKPGKPTALARLDGQLVLALPGNPTSCLSNGYVLLVPMLRALARLPPWHPRTVRAALAKRVASTPDRLLFLPVRIEDGRAVPALKGSGDITSLSRAHGYVEVPGVSLDEGTEVEVVLYE